MRIPRSWVNDFVDLSGITDEVIADAFVRVGFEVEDVIKQGADLSGPLVVARVIAIEELAEHKKPIRYVELDCNEGQTRFVICGARNFEVNDLIVAALPGAVLPGNFAISARETYGKTSNGMICSAKELGLGDDHSGIIVLSEDAAKVGDNATELLQINDTIFDIAVNPDRGYALSIRGAAREIAGALNLNFTDPIAHAKSLSFAEAGTATSIRISDGAMVAVLRSLDSFNPKAPSPIWLSRRVEKVGMRSISLAVDVTNYVMVELGQPLHAFDRAKIVDGLEITYAVDKTKFKTLDDQERVLASSDLVVRDSKQVLALAGTMGGLDSEITDNTTSIAIEAVRFDPIAIAKNSRRHKLSTEASRRLERGVDPSLAEFASARAAELMMSLGGATYVGTSVSGEERYPAIIDFDPKYVNDRLGTELSNEVIEKALTTVGCDVDTKSWKVDPPSWRGDLQIPADLVEEVARIVGYDQIPSVLPRSPYAATLTPVQLRRRSIAAALAARGLIEVQNFPFVAEATMKALNYTGERAATFRIANPMSEETPLMRTHLIPGLIGAAQRNLSRGARDFALFEIGAIFRNTTKLVDGIFPALEVKPDAATIKAIFDSVPPQPIHLGAIFVGKTTGDNWRAKAHTYEWADAIAEAQTVLDLCGLSYTVERSDFAPWHPGRCAELLVDGKAVAHAGELHPRVCSEFGLPPRSCALVINLDALPASNIVRAAVIGAMPIAVQDVALVIDAKVSAAQLQQALVDGAGGLLESIVLFDRYDKIGDGKISLAFTLSFRAPDRTLTGEEISAAREAAVANASKLYGATVRS
jgi:phenylalanyl-tRNA synthetase beta chain